MSMDGRSNVHGDRRIERAVATWAAREGWRILERTSLSARSCEATRTGAPYDGTFGLRKFQKLHRAGTLLTNCALPTTVRRGRAVHPNDCEHCASTDRDRLQRVGIASMPPDDGPSAGHADGGAEHDVAQKVAVVDKSRRRYVRRARERRPRGSISEMPFEHGRDGERRCRMAGRERTALTGRPVATDGLLDALHDRLREDLRSNEIETEVRDFVGARFVSRRRDDVSADRP